MAQLRKVLRTAHGRPQGSPHSDAPGCRIDARGKDELLTVAQLEKDGFFDESVQRKGMRRKRNKNENEGETKTTGIGMKEEMLSAIKWMARKTRRFSRSGSPEELERRSEWLIEQELQRMRLQKFDAKIEVEEEESEGDQKKDELLPLT
jgi:hypothetical protein